MQNKGFPEFVLTTKLGMVIAIYFNNESTQGFKY